MTQHSHEPQICVDVLGQNKQKEGYKKPGAVINVNGVTLVIHFVPSPIMAIEVMPYLTPKYYLCYMLKRQHIFEGVPFGGPKRLVEACLNRGLRGTGWSCILHTEATPGNIMLFDDNVNFHKSPVACKCQLLVFLWLLFFIH